MTVIDATNREIRLRTRPTGLPGPEHFDIVSVRRPAAASGDVLVRNRHFLVSASLRQMISEGAEDIPGVPFPALRPGDPLVGDAIGEVVTAPAGSGLSPGDVVQHVLGWRDYAVMPVAACRKLDTPLPEPLGYLGYLGHGWTAYAALTRATQIHPGETVFISSAAGAIGSLAGQIARLQGAGRVIGSTSSAEKAHRLITECGYDAGVIRSHERSFSRQLRDAAPDGIDVMLDTVGGEQLQAMLTVACSGARVVIVGALSGQLAPTGTGRTAPVTLDSTQLLLRKISIRGYSADDHPDARDEWFDRLGPWCRCGGIRVPHVTIHGLEQAPAALHDTARGRYLGMVIVTL